MADDADVSGPGAMPPEQAREPAHLEVIALEGIPEIRPGDDLPEIIVEALRVTHGALPAREDDVLVVTQKVVSKAEGAIADLTVGQAESRQHAAGQRHQHQQHWLEVKRQ